MDKMAEVATQAEVPPESPASPPPNCPICLGNCMNRSYSNSCMHEFCFRCLLEWSKVKPVCPLCNRSFTRILHSIKSNSEYEQYDIIPNEAPNRQGFYEFHLLTVPQSSRHFQLRTTFTVEPRAQLAIQRMLSAYPIGSPFDMLPRERVRLRSRSRSNRPPTSTTNFRRYIYSENRWVTPPGNFTTYTRDISPEYFRHNPASKFRLEAWLNRELNALLDEDQIQVEFVRNKIMTELDNHHIQSRFFRQLLEEYFTLRTSHFIHEFSCFMKSTYDMVGYDRFAEYTSGMPENSIDVIDDGISSDSDIEIVSVGRVNQDPSVVIDLDTDTSRDSDVIIQEPPPPPVVDLLDTDDSEKTPILPFKKRLLLKRMKKPYKRCRRNESSTNASDSTSSGMSSRKHKHKRKRKSIYYIVKTSADESDDDSSDDDKTLSELQKKKADSKRKKSRKQDYSRIKHRMASCTSTTSATGLKEENSFSDNSCSYTPPPKSPKMDKRLPSAIFEQDSNIETNIKIGTDSPSDYKSNESDESNQMSASDVEENTPGTSNGNLNHPMDLWYNRPNIYNNSNYAYDSSD